MLASETPTPASLPATIDDLDDVLVAQVGSPFQLTFGQSAAVDGLVITFLSVSEDSRCPEGMLCFSAGRVKIVVDIDKDGIAFGQHELTLGTLAEGDVEEVDIDGMIIRLVGVEPYPVMDEQLNEYGGVGGGGVKSLYLLGAQHAAPLF